jgi:hypothetical protein
MTAVFIAACLLPGVILGGVVSRAYWGYWFSRPSVPPEVIEARAVRSVTSLRAADGFSCVLESEYIPDFNADIARSRRYLSEFPFLQAVVALQDRGLLPIEARAPEWLDPSGFYRAVVDTGLLIQGDPGYDQSRCFGGYVIELVLPSGDTRLLLTAGGPQVSNDHHPYYEFLFRRLGNKLSLERHRIFYYDIAGIEGMDLPILHGFLAVLAAPVVAAGFLLGGWRLRPDHQ